MGSSCAERRLGDEIVMSSVSDRGFLHIFVGISFALVHIHVGFCFVPASLIAALMAFWGLMDMGGTFGFA